MKAVYPYFRNYIKESILGPLFKLLEACFELLVPLVIARIVDTIIPSSNQGNLVAMILLLAFFALVGVVVALTAQYFSAKAAVGVAKELTADLYQKILSLPAEARHDYSSASLLNRLSADTLQIQTGINSFLRLFLRAPIVVFGAFLMAFYISPSLSLDFLVMIVALLVVVVLVSWVTNRYYQDLRGLLDKMVAHVRENVLGLRPIRAFGQKEREITEFTTINQDYHNLQVRAGRWSAFLSPATFLVVNTTLVVLIWQGNLAIAGGVLEQGMLVALINYLSQILAELIKMVLVVSTLNQTFISAKRVKVIFNLPSENLDEKVEQEKVADQSLLVNFEQVSFAYPGAAEPALAGIDFSVQKGKMLGIIGGTGSGKSTLIQLILRFYQPTKGQVMLYQDGMSPASLRDWRDSIGLVPQTAQLFRGTIRSNLNLASAGYSDEELWQALSAAQATDFVIEKGGLDAVVEAGGRNFSGGQRQRLTIARALLRKGPILVLDDATSALDHLTEHRLLAAIQSDYPEKTLVLISQRTNSLQAADQILVLEKGCQVALGRHEDLLESSAVYRQINQSQHGEEAKA